MTLNTRVEPRPPSRRSIGAWASTRLRLTVVGRLDGDVAELPFDLAARSVPDRNGQVVPLLMDGLQNAGAHAPRIVTAAMQGRVRVVTVVVEIEYGNGCPRIPTRDTGSGVHRSGNRR